MDKYLIEYMLKRKSIRTYSEKKVSESQLNDIKSFINDKKNYTCPFGSDIRMELFEDSTIDTRNVIKNASVFVVVIIKNNVESLLDAGYIFEKFILFIESLGLATCYLNSGFQRESVSLKEPLKEDEIMVLASPIGYPAERKSIVEKGVSALLKSTKRKSIDELFFSDFKKSTVKEQEVRDKLNYVRWAPSAKNSQPWRIVLDQDKAHFCINNKEYHSKRGDFNIHILDIGIALCHYAIVFNKYCFYHDSKVEKMDDMEYIVSVRNGI